MCTKGNKGKLEANKSGTSYHYSEMDQYVLKTGISFQGMSGEF